MAEIKIQKKQKPIWPWILGIIVIIAAIVLLGREDTREDARQSVAPVTGTDKETERNVPNEVSEYISYVRETNPKAESGLDHDYTAEGLRKLASALDAMADETDMDDGLIEERTNRLEETADFIQKDPSDLTHADSIKAAFVAASEAIQTVQQQNFPALANEAQKVHSAAREIDTQTMTLDQTKSIRNFFDESASALDAMARDYSTNGNNGNVNKKPTGYTNKK